MSFEKIPKTDFTYGLISFGEDGKERREKSGLMSQALINKACAEAVTNVFFFCHGWKGDLPSAKAQYKKWIKAFVDSADIKKAAEIFANFRPLFIGLHWPSLPFGDEELRGGSFGAGPGALTAEALLRTYLKRLGNKPEIRRPLKIIIDEARSNAFPDELPPHIKQAYLDLNEALGLGSGGVGAPPDADREGFDPQSSYEEMREGGVSFGGLNLGGILSPLQQLSYWTMKKRARTVGEGGMHMFLRDLQTSTSSRQTRIHLMGHSFGTIVISGMLGGPNAQGSLPRPVDSVALVQGAVSLWCYAFNIPFPNAGQGYFNHVLTGHRVKGPFITTQSRYDDAVGKLYPFASRLKGSASFAAGYPEYGAIGTYGIQGLPVDLHNDIPMADAQGQYKFESGKIYNLDGSQYICHKEGISGAHSDIAGPEVAHAIWAAAFASV